jgi:hypothetical protein
MYGDHNRLVLEGIVPEHIVTGVPVHPLPQARQNSDFLPSIAE